MIFMLVHKCDACGKVIEDDEENRYKMCIGIVNRRYNKVTDGIERDLCEKCYDRIMCILRNTDENDNKEE